VMEGKGVLFKRFADIDVFDIEINSKNPDDVINTVRLLEPTFGGINLEDIKAPDCFYIEEKLKEMHVEPNLDKALHDVEAVIFAVPHEAYLGLDPDEVVKKIGHPAAIIDAFGILTDEKIRSYFRLGCEVKGLGRGHIQRIKNEVRKSR